MIINLLTEPNPFVFSNFTQEEQDKTSERCRGGGWVDGGGGGAHLDACSFYSQLGMLKKVNIKIYVNIFCIFIKSFDK